MAGRRRESDTPSDGPVLPGDLSVQELYGDVDWDATESGEAEDEQPVVVPPVRLAPEVELAREALASPLLNTAVRLARWVGEYRPVDEWGDLAEDQEAEAATALGLTGEDAQGLLLRAWSLASDLELVTVDKAADGERGGAPESEGEREVARPGAQLAALDASDPESVLALWSAAAALVSETAVEAEADVEALVGPAGEGEEDSAEDAESRTALQAAADAEYKRIEDATEEAEELLDEALQVLYESAAFADGAAENLPLGVLAALLVVPEGEEPDEEMLGEITSVMVDLDPMLQDLAEIGMLDYRPIDPALFEEEDSAPVEAPVSEDEAARFGVVRLTPLGVYGVRQWLLADGYDAPLVGAHAGGSAAELLKGITESANVLPEQEIREWAVGKEPPAAARELLAAARGTDPLSPVRRMFCQVALSELGSGAEPAVRAELDDPQLGGFARAWLVDRGASDVPEPERGMLLWTTLDTLAAQILDETVELELVQELILRLPVVQDPAGFFEELWRIEHPYTAEVLDAIGELHPDRAVGKEARRAAHKARSRG